ncbi:hypothetical protein BY996DRAFT_6511074 [Phakopsora pachyrhizi]|nr:hypothetical protein BY996DRAFT_6511074 [Phakopsora pachyrhizi]
MYADGWRKYLQKEIFGRYINSSGLSRFMKEKVFDVNQEETQYKKLWTLIGFIPILAESGFLAGEEFDVEGGQFILRDHRIAVDFSKISGITLLV